MRGLNDINLVDTPIALAVGVSIIINLNDINVFLNVQANRQVVEELIKKDIRYQELLEKLQYEINK